MTRIENNNKNKVLCVIQARMGSSRLPGKVLKEVNGIPLLEYQIKRVRFAKKIDAIVVATTKKREDDVIKALCDKLETECFRGSENDVLDRYYQCAKCYPEYGTIVRLTGDCPLIDPYWIDKFIEFFQKGNYDYINPSEGAGKETFPEGVAEIDVFTRTALGIAYKNASRPVEREHPTLFFTNNRNFFRIGHVVFGNSNMSHYRLTVDEPQDFEVISFIIANEKINAPFESYIKLLKKYPNIVKKNIDIERNEWRKELEG